MDKRIRLTRTNGSITHRARVLEPLLGENFTDVMGEAIAMAKEANTNYFVNFNDTVVTVYPDSTVEALRASYHYSENELKQETEFGALAAEYDRLLATLPHILDEPIYVGHWLQKALQLHPEKDVADNAFVDAAAHILLTTYDVGQNTGLAVELLQNNNSEHAKYLIGQYLESAIIAGKKCFPERLLGMVDSFCTGVPLDTDFNIIFGDECACGSNMLIDLRLMHMTCSYVDTLVDKVIGGCGMQNVFAGTFRPGFKTISHWAHNHGTSTDTHRSLASANAVIKLLCKEGYAGEGNIFPVRVDIEMGEDHARNS